METIRLVLADDHAVVRAGIRHILQAAPDIAVVGEANNGAEAIQMVRALQPDVLLLDMEMPDMNGVEVARRLNEEKSPVHILALSAYNDKQYIFELLSAGAAGYLTKDEAPNYIIEAVRKVAEGEEGWISRGVAAQMVAWRKKQEEPKKKKLTDREVEVLRLVIVGKTNQEIALELKISEKTVEKHLRAVYTKLGAMSRVEAAVQAVQEELL